MTSRSFQRSGIGPRVGRIGRTCLASLGLTVVACGDLLVIAEPSPELNLSLAATWEVGAEELDEVFDRVDNAAIRIETIGESPVDLIRPVAPNADGIRLVVPVSRGDGGTVRLGVVLRQGNSPIFAGDASIVLGSERRQTAEITLRPLPVAVQIQGARSVELASLSQTLQLRATSTFATGQEVPDLPAQWGSSNPLVASVTQSGLVTAVANGDAVLRASTGEVRDSVQVRVRQAVASVAVTPPTATLQIGERLQLTATPRDAAGFSVPGRTPAWSGGNASVSVSSSGLVTAVGGGSATIVATIDGRTGSSVITVSGPPRISGASYTTELFGSRCDQTDPFAVIMRFSYSDDGGDVPTVVPVIVDYQLQPLGTPRQSTAMVPRQGTGQSGQLEVLGCFRFNQNSQVMMSARIRDAAGLESNSLSIVVARPPGAP